MPHQVPMKDWIVSHPFCGIWLEVGGAKTLTTLAALAEIRPSGHILVIAPLAIARSSWISEIEKWGFPIRTKSLVVDENDKKLSKAARLAIYDEFFTAMPTMYFINQDLVKDLVESMPVKRYGNKRSRVWPFSTVIIDESQEFKNPSGVKFKALKSVRSAIIRLIELTGTPAPQGLQDIWSQIYLLDEGRALGASFLEYRTRYFRPTMFVNGTPRKWELLPGAEEIIHQRIQHLVLSAKNDSIPMQPITFEQVDIPLPQYAQSAYREFKREQVLELAMPDPKNPDTMMITADNAAILRGKLLQFASGTLYTGENHDRDFVQMHEAKLETLFELAVPLYQAREPLMVAFRYRSDAQLIPEYLRQRGIWTEVFDGSLDMRERWNRREIPVMLLQPASYGRGLNLQAGGSELIWYSLPDSLEHWIQTVGRLHRIGQTNPVRVRSLVIEATQDARQPDLLRRKKITQAALVESVRYEIQDDLNALQPIAA
ncbi:MAG TPA: DEAD/DEAH box helicase [Candidatus Lumbricidophila sp.]|nr:DEAD/DEAH box helicase [Candidatus Lumbricidophila sp.]